MRVFSEIWGRLHAALVEVERESGQAFEGRQGRLDWRVPAVLVLACVSVSMIEYYGGSGGYRHWDGVVGWFTEAPEAWLRQVFRTDEWGELRRLWYWSGATVVWYLLVPVLFIKVVLRRRLSEFGLGAAGMGRHAWIYAGLFLVVLPFVVGVAFTPAFQKTYPFYSRAGEGWVHLLGWQLAYALQFLSLEFFYRGFLVHALRPRLGFAAVWVSVIPYCMIHFGKPLPETLGAIIAGVALGTLSLLTRSIWGGVAIHVGVALTMDLLSLGLQGRLWFLQ